DAARPGGGEAAAEPPGPFGVAARHEGGCLLMAHLDEADPVLARAQRFDDAVDAVARQTEDDLDPPIDQRFDEYVAGGHRGHACGSLVECRNCGGTCPCRGRPGLAGLTPEPASSLRSLLRTAPGLGSQPPWRD